MSDGSVWADGFWATGLWAEFFWAPGDAVEGAEITNANATTLVPNNYEQDTKSGFRQYPGDLIRDGYGDYTRRRSYDPRHPQELLRSRGGDKQRGPVRPEGDDVFLSDGEITADDL